MRDNFKTILADNGIYYTLLFATGILVIQVVGLAFVYSKLPPVIPLFNSLSWGKERLVPSIFIFTVPAFLLATCLFNIVYLSIAHKKHALLSRMLSVNLLLAVVLSFIALIQILLLVF